MRFMIFPSRPGIRALVAFTLQIEIQNPKQIQKFK